jgi:hypothetical protein
MGLVGLGLILITLRLLAGKTSAWLINGNVLAVLTLLGACSFVDLGEVTARYNTSHSREVGGEGVELDLCYLNQLGSSALVPLAELQMRADLQPAFKARVDNVRQQILLELLPEQADWRSWEWRNAMRLASLPENLRKTSIVERWHPCDGNDNGQADAAATASPIDAED